jgi:RNA polymerase sigma factor (sigma-70 family)
MPAGVPMRADLLVGYHAALPGRHSPRGRGVDGSERNGLLSSVELLERARRGDRRALDDLLARYLPALRRWASGRLPRWARDLLDTDDLIQETIIKSLRNVEGFVPRGEGALAAYLRQALRNRIRDEVRDAARRPGRGELLDEPRTQAASPLEDAIGAEALERYEAALSRLGDDDRELVLARIEMALGYAEVARSCGRPSPEAARMAVRRALVRLAQEMDRG